MERVRARVVVVGGGITGAFAAFFLARSGAGVTLVHRAHIGAQASFNNPGGLNPLYGSGIPGPLSDLASHAYELHLRWWEDISRTSGIDFRGRKKARLNLAFDDGDESRLEALEESYATASGFSARRLDRAQVIELVPLVSEAVRSGLLAEGDAKVDAAAYTRAVIAAAVAAGARRLTGDVTAFETNGGKVIGVRVGNRTLGCDSVVVATGPWVREPATWLDIDLPIEPIKGDLVTVHVEPDGIPLDLAWRDFAAYRLAGTAVRLGGSEERLDLDENVSERARESILAGIGQILPRVAEARVVSQTTGLRPVTVDGMPIAGLAPGWSNVFLALGGGRKGMLLGAALGLAAAEALTSGATTISLNAFAADRFVTTPSGPDPS